MTKKVATAAELKAVVDNMPADDFTKSGEPKIKVLNQALSEAGFRAIDAKTRDALLEEAAGGPDPFADVTLGKNEVAVLIDEASPQSPVILAVAGRSVKLRVGRVEIIPATLLDALRCSNVPFITKED